MPSIPDTFIDDLLSRVDLHDLIGRYITLKKVGSRFTGVCPFHGDKDPSLSVTPDKGFWYCFGCQAGGDAITFIRKQENLDFLEAVRFIAGLYGIAVPEGASDPGATRRRTLIDINDKSRDFFVRVLKSKHGRPFREYLRNRRINRDSIEAYMIGASLPGWDHLIKHLHKEGYKDQDLIDAGVAIPGKSGGIYDRFRGRLMIPIIDPLDRTLGFGARAMGDDSPKYINSPESQLFQKSRILFGLGLAKKACRDSGQLIIMEGYTDVIKSHQAGVENCCAVMGTALTGEHLPILARFAGEIVLSFDGDEAGLRATTRSLMTLAGHDFKVKVLPLPAGIDPAELIEKEGADKFRERVDKSVEGAAWLFWRYGKPVRDKSISDRLSAFSEVAPYLVAYKSHPIYDELQEKATVGFNLNLSALRTVLKDAEKGARPGVKRSGIIALEYQIHGIEQVERVLFICLLKFPANLPRIRNKIDWEDFTSHIHRFIAKVILQDGFVIGTPDGLLRVKEISENDEAYSYLAGLIVEIDEDIELGDKCKYPEKEIDACLRIIVIQNQYDTLGKGIQADIAALIESSAYTENDSDVKRRLLELMQKRKELDNIRKEISLELGCEEYGQDRCVIKDATSSAKDRKSTPYLEMKKISEEELGALYDRVERMRSQEAKLTDSEKQELVSLLEQIADKEAFYEKLLHS